MSAPKIVQIQVIPSYVVVTLDKAHTFYPILLGLDEYGILWRRSIYPQGDDEVTRAFTPWERVP
jgi:hypothetical protein